jgi:hypothetical protein
MRTIAPSSLTALQPAMAQNQNLVRFETWAQVLEAARRGVQLWYGSPLDASQAYPHKQVRVVRVYKNGKLRVDPLTNQAGPFTCDAGHLYRFRKRPDAV